MAGYKFQPSHAVSITVFFVQTYKEFICPDAGLIEQADLFAFFLPLIEERIREG
jgi:acetone carboxylase gamma subunit